MLQLAFLKKEKYRIKGLENRVFSEIKNLDTCCNMKWIMKHGTKTPTKYPDAFHSKAPSAGLQSYESIQPMVSLAKSSLPTG